MSPNQYKAAYNLFTQGVRAPPDDMTCPGTVKTTPRRIRDGKGRYTMTPSQMHAYSRIIDIFDQGHGALLALDMGLGKTLVVLGKALFRLEKIGLTSMNSPHSPPTRGESEAGAPHAATYIVHGPSVQRQDPHCLPVESP